MIQINKAILHTMDSKLEQYSLASEDFYLDIAIKEYITKHIEKALKRNDAQKATFKLSSRRFEKMKEYTSSKFTETTREIANEWFEVYVGAKRFPDMNLLFVEYYNDDIPYFGCMQFKNKNGYIRDIKKENGNVVSEIITNNRILPSSSQNVEEFFFINLKEYDILFKESKKYFNNDEELLISDILLYCDSEMSLKQSVQTLNNIIVRVSDELEENVLDNQLKMKRLLKSCLDTTQVLDTSLIAPVAFEEDEKFQELLNQKMMEESIPKEFNLKMKAPANIKKHKIKTDLGIEVNIPVDLAGNSDLFQIIEHTDGTISIQLNNIGRMID